MPHYFFDIHDSGTVEKDEMGAELPDLNAVRKMAMRTLPDIARQEIPKHGDCRAFAVLVTDEDGQPVYSATLNYTGLWLLR